MNEKETLYLQSIELENAKLKQEIALLKSQLFYDTAPTTNRVGVAFFPVYYPPGSNHPAFKD